MNLFKVCCNTLVLVFCPALQMLSSGFFLRYPVYTIEKILKKKGNKSKSPVGNCKADGSF